MTLASIIFLIFALLCLGEAIRENGRGEWGLSGFPWLIAGALLTLAALVVLVVTL